MENDLKQWRLRFEKILEYRERMLAVHALWADLKRNFSPDEHGRRAFALKVAEGMVEGGDDFLLRNKQAVILLMLDTPLALLSTPSGWAAAVQSVRAATGRTLKKKPSPEYSPKKTGRSQKKVKKETTKRRHRRSKEKGPEAPFGRIRERLTLDEALHILGSHAIAFEQGHYVIAKKGSLAFGGIDDKIFQIVQRQEAYGSAYDECLKTQSALSSNKKGPFVLVSFIQNGQRRFNAVPRSALKRVR